MKAMSVLEALGEGIISVPETLWDGVKRTGQGLEFWNEQEQDKIGAQDIRAFRALKQVFKYGITDRKSPVEQAIRIILYHFYESLPPAEKKKVIDAATKKGWFFVGKASTSFGLSYGAGRLFINRLAIHWGTKVALKLTVSAEFNLLSMQGILFKAGAASDRLRAKFPKIWSELRRHNLDMVYFLIEKPMQRYLEAIRLNRMKLHVRLQG